MGRPMNPHPKANVSYPVTIYLKNGKEAMMIRMRAKELGKTLSTYGRDLFMEDIIKSSKRGLNGELTYDPFNQKTDVIENYEDTPVIDPELEAARKLAEEKQRELDEKILKDAGL